MKANKEKLKNASIEDILKELSTIADELDNQMYPPSWSRTKMLFAYRETLLRELKLRI